ncbi:MAG: hypothetical protein QM564_04535 [Bergeyella sp.]
MANLRKKVIGVDVSSKVLVLSLLNDEEKHVIINFCNRLLKQALKIWKLT